MNIRLKGIFKTLLIWRVKHLNDRYFVMLMSAIIGLTVGLALVLLKNSVYFVQWALTNWSPANYENYLYFFSPALGILLTVLFARGIKRNIGGGVGTVLLGIKKKKGNIHSHHTFSSIVGSALTVGLGGSAGLEGPGVLTGGAIGSYVGRSLHMSPKQVMLLIGCATSAAIATLFKAPIAAIIFAIEVLLIDLTTASLIPLFIASISAVLTSYLFFGKNVIYPIDKITEFDPGNIPLYVGLGIFTGLISMYFIKVYFATKVKFDKVKSWRVKIIIGGLILGTLIFLFPPLYGEGFSTINSSLKPELSFFFLNTVYYKFQTEIWMLIAVLALIVVFKVIATAVTLNCGGVGGIFAPSLFLGSTSGLLFAHAANTTQLVKVPETNFALAGMAGMISGVLHAPFTAIFLIAELTNGYSLILPLMFVSAISYLVSRYFEPKSIYVRHLADDADVMSQDKDKAVLALINIEQLIETNFKTIKAEAGFDELIDTISKSSRNLYPVVDDNNNLVGIVFLDHIRHFMFKPDIFKNLKVSDVMFTPQNTISPNDTIEDIVEQFQISGNYNLAVVDNGKYIGFVSRANLYTTYRNLFRTTLSSDD